MRQVACKADKAGKAGTAGRVAVSMSILAAALLTGPVAVADVEPDPFAKHWSDGKAELSGYALTQPRYGQLRRGSAVLIFVTEDFSDAERVKVEGPHPPEDVFQVLKLNTKRSFQTGIYDYDVMTSTFARTEWPVGVAPWPVAKVSFSAQEWCGQVYQQWLTRPDRLIGLHHSYFDGESDGARTLPNEREGVFEDALPVLVRELRGGWIAPGQTSTLPLMPSALSERLEHRPADWTRAKVTRSAGTTRIPSVLGNIEAYGYVIARPSKGPGSPELVTTYDIEAAYPHRILGWAVSSGETAKLTGSARLPYWELNREGGESERKHLGLPLRIN